MRTTTLSSLLNELNASSIDIGAAGANSNDALPLVPKISGNMDEGSVAAMSAAVLSKEQMSAERLSGKNVEQVITRGNQNYTLMTPCGREELMAKAGASLEWIFQ